jgi:hypothetical protein
MKRKILFALILFLVLVFLIPTLVGAASASENGGYEINNWTADGGGGESQGGEYILNGTIGQHDAGDVQGGEFTLHGGFWIGGVIEMYYYLVHLPVLLR